MNYKTTSKLTALLIGALILTLSSAESLHAGPKIKIPNGSIKGPKLANGSVTASKLADGSVTETKLADGSVTETKLADGSVTETKLADGSVTEAKLADGSVTEAKLADGSVTALKLDPSVPLTEDNLSIVRGTFGGGGEALAGGGTGYASVRNSIGLYTVTFTVPFSATPTIVVTPSSPNAGTPVASASVSSRTATGFVLSIYNISTGNPEDWHSNFIAIGSR